MAPGTLAEKVRGTWKILAFGGAGYNYYMAHGGTNFGYSGSGEAPGVSYDYSAPVGEAGQLHNLYFPARRAAYFAQTFTSTLVGSHNDPTLAKSDQSALRINSRTNPKSGSIIFIDHFHQFGVAPVAAIAPDASAYHAPKADPNVVLETHIAVNGLNLPHQGSLKITTQEPRTVIVNLPWTDNATFESICTNVLFRETIGNTDTWVCYGPAGDSGEITLTRKTPLSAPTQLDFNYPAGNSVTEYTLDSGDGHHARFLIMNTEMTDRTWFAQGKLYVGPSFVLENGRLEFPPEGGKATIYSGSGKSEVTQGSVQIADLPALSAWTWRDGAAERASSLDTKTWLTSTGPQPMECYNGFENRYGWYRTTLHLNSNGPLTLHLGGQSGTFTPFLNGVPEPVSTLTYGEKGSLQLLSGKAGDNSLAILVKAAPRPKTTYRGTVGMKLARGIWTGVSLDSAPTPLLVKWKKWDKAAQDANPNDIAKPDYNDGSWNAVDSGSLSLNLNKGNTWYRGSFMISADQVDSMIESPEFLLPKPAKPQKSPPPPARILFYLNGHLITEPIADASKYLVAGKNTALLETQSRLGGELGDLVLKLWHNSPLTHSKWSFHGGVGGLEETAVIGRVTNWVDFLTQRPWSDGSPSMPGMPTLWKCAFTYTKSNQFKESIGLETTGLKAGHVWLNGHNLGESPQIYPLYMPEAWLRNGENDLVIFDLYGNRPDQLKLTRYEAFSIHGTD